MKKHPFVPDFRSLIVLIVTLLSASSSFACATVPKTKPIDPRDRISRATIARMNVVTAYEAIARKLNRPIEHGLRGGPVSFERPQLPLIMIDGIRSEVAALYTLPALQVDSVLLLQAAEATLRFGTGGTNGAIVLFTCVPR